METQSSELALNLESGLGHRVLIDARKICDGGIGVYTANLIAGLCANGNEVTVLGDPERISTFSWSKEVEVIEEHAAGYSLSELFGLRRRIDFSKYDLFHTPHYVLPYGIPIPSVVTIHDLIHVYAPERMYYPWIASQLVRSAVKRASKVVVVSQATLAELRKFFGPKSRHLKKVSVVPNAINPFFLSHQPSNEFVRARFGLHGRYFLAVASMLKPHKGLRDLFRAFQRVQQVRSALDIGDIKLALVGKGTESLVEVEKLLNAVGSIKGVHLLGSVSQEELLHLYGGAEALVVPSKAEGFCLPVLEAQALGTPVIARPVPAIEELLTASDRTARDFSVESLVDEMISFLQEDRNSRTILTSSTDRARRMKAYDANELAKVYMNIYSDATKRRQLNIIPLGAHS